MIPISLFLSNTGTLTHTSLSRQTVDLNDGVQPKTIDLLFFFVVVNMTDSGLDIQMCQIYLCYQCSNSVNVGSNNSIKVQHLAIDDLQVNCCSCLVIVPLFNFYQLMIMMMVVVLGRKLANRSQKGNGNLYFFQIFFRKSYFIAVKESFFFCFRKKLILIFSFCCLKACLEYQLLHISEFIL